MKIEVKHEHGKGVDTLVKDTFSRDESLYEALQEDFHFNYKRWASVVRASKFVQLNKARPGLHLEWIPF